MAKNNIPAVVWIEKEQRWRLYGTKNGVRKKFSSSNPSAKTGPAECKKKYLLWLGSDVEDSSKKFCVAWEEFLAEMQKTTSKSNYRQREQIGRIYLLPYLKNKIIDSITSLDYQRCINSAYDEKNLSRKSLENIRGTITTFCSFARLGRYTDLRPELKIPRQAKKGKRTILQPDQLKKLFAEKGDIYLVNGIQFIILTGLRRSEALGLKWSDLKNGYLHISRGNTEDDGITDGKNENANRVFKPCQQAVNVLKRQKEQLKEAGLYQAKGWMFPAFDGSLVSPKAFASRWNRYSKKHDYSCSIQELRHTFVSVSKNKMPQDLLKRVVGHSKSMDTYGVYGHLVDGELDEAQRILDQAFSEIIDMNAQ